MQRAVPAAVADLREDGWLRAAHAIMTTDTRPKLVSRSVEVSGHRLTITGIAKGAGMIHPNMATMLGFITTDAKVAPAVLQQALATACDATFNAITVDGECSTNDCVMILANGASGVAVDEASIDAFSHALREVCLRLALGIVRGGEGATKLLAVTVRNAHSVDDARQVARTIANSPLVKTAVHGADPNWGRVAMAIGKSASASEVDQTRVVIRFGSQEVYPARLDETGLAALAKYMRGTDVRIHVSLATGGDSSATVWGCDLTDGYVRINADYTT